MVMLRFNGKELSESTLVVLSSDEWKKANLFAVSPRTTGHAELWITSSESELVYRIQFHVCETNHELSASDPTLCIYVNVATDATWKKSDIILVLVSGGGDLFDAVVDLLSETEGERRGRRSFASDNNEDALPKHKELDNGVIRRLDGLLQLPRGLEKL